MTKKLTADRVALYLFVGSVVGLVFLFGAVVGKYQFFPYRVLAQAAEGSKGVRSIIKQELPEYYKDVVDRDPAPPRDTSQAYQGLNLVTKVNSDGDWVAEIMDMDGQKLHEWQLDWFKIWPDTKHVTDGLPRARPAYYPHGALVMENGDLVFNSEFLGLIRLETVAWRLLVRQQPFQG